jgi:aryl-alcohol dehydrogenase-like predicted oxidoreductase
MPLSLKGRPSESDAIRVIHAALDAGMTLIDTADVYCIDNSELGHNERLIGRALREWSGDRSAVVVATKGGLDRPGGDWVTRAGPEQLKEACERSLKSLGVETIALYQLHAPDPDVPYAYSVGALADLQAEGKIQHVGLSNVGVAEIEQARRIVNVVSVQNRFNPFDGEGALAGTMRHCHEEGLAYLAYSPVGGQRGHARMRDDRVLGEIADKRGVSPYQVTLAWMLALTPMMIPIPGASRIESATSSAAAAEVALSDEEMSAISRHSGAGVLGT